MFLQFGCIPFKQIDGPNYSFSDENIKVSLVIESPPCLVPSNLESLLTITLQTNSTNNIPINISQITGKLSTKQVTKYFSNIYGETSSDIRDAKPPPFTLSNSDTWSGYLSGKIFELGISNLSAGDKVICDFSILYTRLSGNEMIFTKTTTNLIIERTNSKGHLESCYF